MQSLLPRMTALTIVSSVASGFAVAPPLAASESALLDSSCSRLLWIGEENEYGLDEQVFVAEADGRDRTRLSALSPRRILANSVDGASWMPDSRVLFREGGRLWIANSDGSGLRTIDVDRPGVDRGFIDGAVVAPNGRKIATHTYNGVYVFRPNGNLVGSYAGPSSRDLTWASTGDAMAWVEYEFRSPVQSLVVADGLARNAVVLSSGSANPDYRWAPDGSRIAWTDDSSLSVADKDGANPITIASGGARPMYDWSPDSSTIAFSDGSSISLAGKDGSGRTLVWSSPSRSPRWSPDGSKLAWIDGSSIMVADAAGADATAITSTAGQFEWSPDNRRIAWFDGSALQLVNISGSPPIVLPMETGVEDGVYFSFSPDGARLAWTTDEETGVFDVDGTETTVFPAAADEDVRSAPLWSPDSTVFALSLYSDIVVFNADGTAHRRILSAYPSDWYEVSLRGWSPCIFTPLGPSPDNDRFANAEYLDGASEALASGSTSTVYGTTVEATADAGEPPHRRSRYSEPLGPRNSIWYRWTADVDRVVEIDTLGSETGTVLVAYTGATESELTEIAGGIDDKGGVTRIRFAARAGETYHLAVDGYGTNSEGAVQLNIRRPGADLSECTITGTDGPDVLIGTRGADVICALGGADTITSLGGADVIFAGEGNDFVSAGGGTDTVFGEGGNDVLVGGSGADLLDGGPRGDRIFGGEGNDTVFGGSGADRLYGAAGDDVLFGEMGDDRLFGAEGDDHLDGGPFADTCVDADGDNTVLNC